MQTLAAINTHLNNIYLARMTAAYICSPTATPMAAARWGHYEIAAAVRDEHIPRRMFRQACRGGHMAIVEMLIARGECGWYGGFFAACRGGHEDIVRLMCTRQSIDTRHGFSNACCGGNPVIMDSTMDNDQTNIRCDHAHCKMGTLPVAQYLVHKTVMYPGRLHTLVIAACRGGHMDTLEFLRPYDIADSCEQGLYAACRGGHIPAAETMVAYGARGWQRALLGACSGGHMRAVEYVMSKIGGDIHNPWMLLRYACEGGHLDVARHIIPHVHNATDEILMRLACASGNVNIVRLLMSRGNTRWDDGMQGASEGGHLELVKFMAAQGAANWDTCLDAAAAEDHAIIAQYAISNGATIVAIARARTIAENNGNVRLVACLRV
jgi:hypothetical protein